MVTEWQKVVTIDEFSLVPFVIQSLVGRPPLVIEISPLLPPLTRMMEAIVGFFDKRSSARQSRPGQTLLTTLRKSPHKWKTTDLFLRCEEICNKAYKFDELDAKDFRLAYPYKNVSVNYFQRHLRILDWLQRLAAAFPAEKFLYRTNCPWQFEIFTTVTPMPANIGFDFKSRWFLPFNALMALAVCCIGYFRIFRWVSMRPPAAKSVYLGFDAITDRRLLTTLSELSDDPNGTLGVFRNKHHWNDGKDWFGPYPVCPLLDGVLSIRQSIAELKKITAECFRLARRFGRYDPRHTFLILKFPLVELTYFALMEKYHFQNFFGRDDYNVEHIFRTWEIRKRGGRSLGINHGTPYYPIIDPVWRYLDFDVYFVFGSDLYEKYYQAVWPPSMRIVNVGSFGMTRAQFFEALKAHPGRQDIGVFLKLFDDDMEPEWAIEIVRVLAEAFPDKTVYLKPKYSGARDINRDLLNRFLSSAPANIVVATNDAYDVLSRVRYCVSSPSTIVFEAINLGVVSFCYDIYPETTPLHFRDYPNLCYLDPEAIVARIRSIEDGSWGYPRETFSGLIDISGTYTYELIKTNMLGG